MNALGTAREIIDAMLTDIHSTLLLHVYHTGVIVEVGVQITNTLGTNFCTTEHTDRSLHMGIL